MLILLSIIAVNHFELGYACHRKVLRALSMCPRHITRITSIHSSAHPSIHPLHKMTNRLGLLKQPGRQAVRYLNPVTISKQGGGGGGLSIQKAPTYRCIQWDSERLSPASPWCVTHTTHIPLRKNQKGECWGFFFPSLSL